MFLSKKYLVSLILVFLFSVILCFFPLIGVLGFEYSVFSSIFLSFISLFISAEVVNDTLNKTYSNFNITDFLAKLFLFNLVLLIINFAVGMMSSLISKDCSIDSGVIFYLLIPFVTVVYSTALGSLTGSVFRKRGFIIGALILIFTIIYSIYELYSQPHIFFFNPIIGYFPGSIYDKYIPITTSLVLYRLIIIAWAVLIFTFVNIFHSYKKGSISLSSLLLLFLLITALIFAYVKEESIGLRYSRKYIQNNVLPSTYETDHFLIHYDPGTKTGGEIEIIANDHEWRYNEISNYLDVALDNKINSYIYPNKESRKKYIGTRDATIAPPMHQEIHLVYEYFPIDVLKHELVHILSSEFGSNILKISPQLGLIEGLAVAVDWPMNGMTKHQFAKTLVLNGAMNGNLEDFLGYGFWYYPQFISYTLMGSYSRYLIDTFGVDNFKEYYKTGDTDVYDKTEDELIASWIIYLNNEIELPEDAKNFSEYKFSEKSIFEDVCPRKTDFFISEGFKDYRNENFYGSTRNFEKAYDLNQNNPNVKTALAYSYYFNKDFDKLLNLNTDGLTKIDINVIKNLKTNILWDRKGYDYAYPYFVKLKESSLPNDIQRSIELIIDLKRFNKNIKKSYKEFLLTDDPFEKIAVLEDIKQRYRSYGPAYYLLGRIYLRQGSYNRAIENLEIAEIRRLPGKNLRMENLKSLGVAQYATGDYYGAIKTFNKLANLDADGGEYKSYAENFINRAKWELNN